ncbi:hypothetical protein GCM10020295_79210 [Streptomyces cinereospinus]
MAHDVSTALIVGGGIAGLSAAIALSRAGVQCEVLELADAPGGASLALSGRATEALDELGVYDALHARSTPFTDGTTAAHQMDEHGRLLSKGPQRPQWPGAKTPLGVHRPALLELLQETAQGLGAEVHRGVTTQTVDERGDGVFVTTTDGREARYDLVVGADGIGSRTRSRIFPESPRPAYSGQFSFRWMLSGPPIEGEGWYNGPEGRLGFYHLPGNLIYVPAVVDLPEGTWLTEEDTYAHFTRLLDSFTAPAVVELRRRLAPGADLIARPFEWILLPAPPGTGGAPSSSVTPRTRRPHTWAWVAGWRSRTPSSWGSASRRSPPCRRPSTPSWSGDTRGSPSSSRRAWPCPVWSRKAPPPPRTWPWPPPRSWPSDSPTDNPGRGGASRAPAPHRP